MKSERIQYIDRLKGFAIFCVIVGHLTINPLGQRFRYNQDNSRNFSCSFIVFSFRICNFGASYFKEIIKEDSTIWNAYDNNWSNFYLSGRL